MKDLNKSMRASLACLVIIYQIITLGCSIAVPPPSTLVEDMRRQEQVRDRQHERVAEMQRSVATGAADLVNADASARKDWIAVQSQIERSRHDLVAQQDTLLTAHDSLEQERKAIAKERITGSVLVAFISELGPPLLCSLPLFLLLILLLRSDKTFRSDPFPDVVMDHVQMIRNYRLDDTAESLEESVPHVPARITNGDQINEHH